MSAYDVNGNELFRVYDSRGALLSQAYSKNGTSLLDGGEILPTPTAEAYTSGYIDDNGELRSLNGNYVSDIYRPATEKITVIVGENELPDVSTIRIAEYDGSKSFIQRQYIQRCGFYEFILDSQTRYIRVGFQTINASDLTNLFTYYQITNNPVLCSQIGYDSDKAKRATIVDKDSVTFHVANSANVIVYSGTVEDGIADFTDFVTPGTYYLYCDGIRSWSFTIGSNRLWNVMARPSLAFMEQSRQDVWDVGSSTGYAWRDSHQFSFELNGLVMQYMSNPSYYESLPWDVYRVGDTEYADLRTQDCPNIVWLMKFAIERYYDWNTNDNIDLHALIKGQIAYFLYLYPHISNYVDATWYATIRDWCISIWSVTTCNKSWYDVSINHSLFETQSAIGGVKGACPPGYAVVPNFMMYEVCTRDGLNTASQFLTAAENNIAWLVNSVDLANSANTKGQRMSEYIPFHALTYAYEMYPNSCPTGTYAKIAAVAQSLISLSNNIWDYTKYSSERWVNLETSGGLCNNPGYVGMMGVYFALARVITDTSIKARLKELAISHIDHGFGRNPLNRCFSYYATRDFSGAKQGWVSQLNGAGDLNWVTGVLDGSPKEENFPYVPSGSTGYTEGWVAFNSAWNMALAYLNGENESITDGIGIFAKSN